MFRTVVRRVVATTTILIVLATGASSAQADSVTGTVSVGFEGVALKDVGAIVVFIEAKVSGRGGETQPSIAIRQSGAQFEPDFVAVSVGQKIEMPNDDIIYHNVFSYSEPNDFDLGLYASGESHSIAFDHPGLVRIYCSIHDEMDGLIFVAPSPLYAIVDGEGRYSISGIPSGRHRLRVWVERMPELVETVEVESGESITLDLEIGKEQR